MSSNSTIQRLPVEVDPFKLVEQGRLFEGRIPQQDFKRLQDLLFPNDEDDYKLIEVNLEFTRTDTRLPVIKGHIKAELQMVCNRCLDATDLYMTVDKHAQLTQERQIELTDKRESARIIIREYRNAISN